MILFLNVLGAALLVAGSATVILALLAADRRGQSPHLQSAPDVPPEPTELEQAA